MLDPKIKTLIKIVELGSYTKASENLALTQPAVSHHIKMLEREYDIKIFYSDKKNLKLTPEGEILLKYARRAQAISTNARQAIEDNRLNLKHLTIAMTPSANEQYIPQALAIYCNEHPATHINIQTDTIKHIYNKLKDYEVDIGIVEGRPELPGLISILLDTDCLSLVVSPEHRFARRKSVTLSDLKGENFILRSKKAGTRKLFESYLNKNDFNLSALNIIIETDNLSTIKELVALNYGITIISNSSCTEEERSGKLVIVPIDGVVMLREINMVHNADFDHADIFADLKDIYKRLDSLHRV